jgi:hypothetical protein
MNKPQRKYTVQITLGADTIDDAISALGNIQFDLRRLDDFVHYNTASGGYSSGYSMQIECKKEQTPDNYKKELSKYLSNE